MAEKAFHQQPDLFNGSQLSTLIDQSNEVSDALTDLVNKCLYTEELVVVQLQTHANLDIYQDYFINNLDDSFDVVTVNAHLLMSTEELFGEIVEQLDLDVDLQEVQGNLDKLTFVLGQTIDELKAESAELVLQVNFAHELSSGVLNELIALIQSLSNRGAFHAVLWMDLDSAMAFESRISSLDIDFSTIEILRFSAAEINEYLKFVFASYEQPFVFSKENVKQIIVGSGGEAGKIDQLAREALERKPGRSGRKKDEYLLLKSMVAVAVTALVIIFMLPDDEVTNPGDNEIMEEPERVVIAINQPEQNEPQEEETVFIPPVVADLPDTEIGTNQLAADDEDLVADVQNEIQNDVQELAVEAGQQELAEGEVAALVEVQDSVPIDVSETTLAAPELAEEAFTGVAGQEVALVEVVDAVPALPVQSENELAPYEQQLQELLNSADNEAFIQLLGTYDEGVAQGFIDNYEIDDSFYYVRTDLNGRDWFVVLYGSFVSERAAINALDALPVNLRQGDPWVRNMRNIRSTVKQ